MKTRRVHEENHERGGFYEGGNDYVPVFMSVWARRALCGFSKNRFPQNAGHFFLIKKPKKPKNRKDREYIPGKRR